MTISFIVKVRNEEGTIEESIRSLFLLSTSISYEIIIILHLCTDDSEKICIQLQKENERIKIFYYHHEISKCGYENLCTKKDSLHSVVTYYNWCLQKASYPWKFKWDADFIASPELIHFLNTHDWINKRNIRYKICAANFTHVNKEHYLSDSIVEYKKYIFWEVPTFTNCESEELDDSIRIIHNSQLSDCKAYWKTIPWFMFDDTNTSNEEEEAERQSIKEKYLQLMNDIGEEPVGMARASNPECDEKFLSVLHNTPTYIQLCD